jgi:hypothetical protein
MVWVVAATASYFGVSTAAAATGLVLGASTVASTYGGIEASKSQQDELNRQAEEKKIAAEFEETKRRQALNKALAANNLSMAMDGLSGKGTPASISLKNAENIGFSEGVVNLTDTLAQSTLRRQARTARSMGNIKGVSTLLKGASNIAMLGGGIKSDDTTTT